MFKRRNGTRGSARCHVMSPRTGRSRRLTWDKTWDTFCRLPKWRPVVPGRHQTAANSFHRWFEHGAEPSDRLTTNRSGASAAAADANTWFETRGAARRHRPLRPGSSNYLGALRIDEASASERIERNLGDVARHTTEFSSDLTNRTGLLRWRIPSPPLRRRGLLLRRRRRGGCRDTGLRRPRGAAA